MKETRGFTLVELVIVVVILGILSAIALPRYIGTTDSAKLATKLAVGAAIKTAYDLKIMEWRTRGSPQILGNFFFDTANNGVTGYDSGGAPTAANFDASKCAAFYIALVPGLSPLLVDGINGVTCHVPSTYPSGSNWCAQTVGGSTLGCLLYSGEDTVNLNEFKYQISLHYLGSFNYTVDGRTTPAKPGALLLWNRDNGGAYTSW